MNPVIRDIGTHHEGHSQMRTLLQTAALTMILLSSAAAQEPSDESLVTEAKATVSKALGRSEDQIVFERLSVSRGDDRARTVVCGVANSKRFVASTGEKAGAPNIEGNVSPTVFNYLWNLRCAKKKPDEALSTFKEDLRENVCTVDSWNWTRWGTRSMQIQGLASCQSGRILIKVFDKDQYLGSGTGTIEARAFTVYIDRRPTGNSVRIEYATGK
jgi:hypothetical protein